MSTIPTSGFVSMLLHQHVTCSDPHSMSYATGPRKLGHRTDKRFADLNISAESRRALSQVFKYKYMTAVQSKTLSLILEKDSNDCLSKETLASMIPTIEKIMVTMSKGSKQHLDVHCLVISPTRELA